MLFSYLKACFLKIEDGIKKGLSKFVTEVLVTFHRVGILSHSKNFLDYYGKSEVSWERNQSFHSSSGRSFICWHF